MSTHVLVLVLLAGAALFASVRVLRHAPRHRVALVALQWLAAAALYVFLFPPIGERGATLVVLTRGASAAQATALPAGANVIALPEAYDCAPPDCLAPAVRALRVPDLATAMRAHPEATVLHVVGSGLGLRDRDAARGLALRFEPPPGPHGFVAVDTPAHVAAGSTWMLSGRVDAAAGARVELRDPGNAVVATATPASDGAFHFDSSPSRLPGPALFQLRLLGDGDTVIDELPVPLAAEAAQPARVLLLAGAPDPEIKYVRRWALDAGVTLDVRMAIGPDTALGATTAPRDAAALADYALAIVDERAWATLAPEQRRALAEAVDAGLGLLLRVTGPATKIVADDWRTLGFTLAKAEIPQGVTLAHALALEPASATFARVPLSVQATDATPLLRDDAGDPLALMRARGRGRVALWWLQDSFRLALAGAPERHATLWSRVFTTLARTHDQTAPETPRYAWVGRRAALCALPEDAAVRTPAGASVPLRVDAATGADRCAAYWPEQSGWHELIAGEQHAFFHVLAANQGRALAAGIDREATAELAALHPSPPGSVAAAMPWRWLAALLALAACGALWWLERRAAQP